MLGANENPSDSDQKSTDLKVLQGKTLLVYWTLLKSGESIGVRELQRKLDFSSPSLVIYHLNKLEEIELVGKSNDGMYFAKRRANISELRDLIIFRTLDKTFILPRMMMYAIFFSILYIFYIPVFFIFDFGIITNSSIFVNIFAISGILILWYETYKAYIGLPFN